MRKFKMIFKKVVIILSIVLIIVGCEKSGGLMHNTNVNEEIMVDHVKDKVFEGTINTDNIDFYTYSSGSTSVNENFAIYKYQDSFIFVERFFNCGDDFMETYLLTKEQEEKFIEALNNCNASTIQPVDSVGEGGSITKGGISINGEYYPVKGFNLESIGIEMQDIYDVDFPEETFIGNDVFDKNAITNIINNSNNSEKTPLYLASEGFERVIYNQITKEIGDNIAKISVVEENKNDFILDVFTGEEKEYKVTVTYMGYVANIELK